MELRILTAMKAIQEEKLEKEAKRIADLKKGNKNNEYVGIPAHLQAAILKYS